ncbi:RICIN domain-containing protein [Micromonospora sp. NPDC049114]|uniref:RICIN domain-containing protein n=1 Tax=Micromonospora sp. NPDC049114 TaxID=3155498 RepID=UPI0033D02F66
MIAELPSRTRRILSVFVALVVAVTAGLGLGVARSAQAAPTFKVLAFYNGTWDAAHIDFDRDARAWFPQAAAQYGFSWEATTNWGLLNTANLAQYKVIMFLDDAPPAAQRPAFQQYMQNGGAWMGFHVSAFTTDPSSWSWYYNTFLGSGSFQTNTWGPTRVTMRADNRTHPATQGLPATFASSISEWYSWSNDLRQNPDIDILASVDPSSFPVGTDPNQSWYGGYYPLVWSNKRYKMLYANFGHNAMNYSTNTGLSSTFDSPQQNKLLIDGLHWLAGTGTAPTPTPTPTGTAGPISPTAWHTVVNRGSGKCVDARAAGTANGTAIQQYACNSSAAQQYQFAPTSGGYLRVNNRGNSAQVLDVTDRSTADSAPIQLWSYSGGNNQQWRAESEGGGYYRLVNRNSGKCLDVPGASTADSVQLIQYTCNGTAAQSFRLVSVS